MVRGKNVAIIAAANTFGTGADLMYAGRNQLDAATLDRFYVVKMDYDEALEQDISGVPPTNPLIAWAAAPKPDEEELLSLGRWIKDLRSSVMQHRLRRVVSTRTFQKAFAARRAGLSTHEVKLDTLAGWTQDDMAKAAVTV